MATVEELVRPLGDDAPGGPDLSYDAKRLEIEQAFETAASGEDGQATDWRQIIKLILEQAEQTRDVWLPVYLARAGARAGRLETVELGCEYLAQLFETLWDGLHPGLEDYGFQGRKGPCESLVRIGEFLAPFRRIGFVTHPRLGSFSGEDLERFASEGDSAENYGLFRAALDDVPPEEIQETLDRLDRIRAAIARVDAALSAHADGDTGTNFTPTYAAIDSIRRGLAQHAGLAVAEAASGDEAGEAPSDSAAPTASPGEGGRLRGAIESRDDVLKALDAIVDYYRRREPGSPVPVAIARAKSWVNLDFLSVLEDIAPDSVGEARRVLTSKRDEED